MAYLDKTGLVYFWSKVKAKINAKASMLDCYPVGAIYMSVNSTSPASLFGGTWEQLKDRFLLAAGDTFKAGSTGGEATHTLKVFEMPSHSHYLYYDFNAVKHDNILKHVFQHDAYLSTDTYNMMPNAEEPYGADQPHNNMPPYLAVYIWKRIA